MVENKSRVNINSESTLHGQKEKRTKIDGSHLDWLLEENKRGNISSGEVIIGSVIFSRMKNKYEQKFQFKMPD